jgi:hypothetical protein
MTRDERRCALYRHYDDQDVLLYVGISATPVDRTNAHARGSEWAAYAERAEAQWFNNRESAEAAEREAIRTEVPIFNRAGAVGNVDQRIEMYVRAREAQSTADALATYEHCANQLLKVLPAELLEEEVFRATHHDFACAGEPVDRTFSAHALRHAGDLIDTVIWDWQHFTAIIQQGLALLPADKLAHYREQVKADHEQLDGPDAWISPADYAAETAAYALKDYIDGKALV